MIVDTILTYNSDKKNGKLEQLIIITFHCHVRTQTLKFHDKEMAIYCFIRKEKRKSMSLDLRRSVNIPTYTLYI